MRINQGNRYDAIRARIQTLQRRAQNPVLQVLARIRAGSTGERPRVFGSRLRRR